MATAENTQAQGNTPDTGNPRKRKVMLIGLALIVILCVVGVWAWHEFYGRFNESTDDAYVNGNVVEITPLVTGTVVSIGADDGDLVHEGQVLINFDPNDAEVGLQSAQANLARTVRQVRGLYIRDYIRIWDSYLKDVQIQRPAQFEQAVDLARVLASPQSPLKKFLEEVSENTRLAGGLVKTGEKLETLTNQKAQQTLSPSAALLAGSDFKATDFEAPLEQQVDDYFSDINNLFEGNPPAYNQVSGLLNDLYAQLAAIASAKKSKSAPPPAASMDSLQVGAGVLPEPVRAIVGQLAGQGSAQGRAFPFVLMEQLDSALTTRPNHEELARWFLQAHTLGASALDEEWTLKRFGDALDLLPELQSTHALTTEDTDSHWYRLEFSGSVQWLTRYQGLPDISAFETLFGLNTAP